MKAVAYVRVSTSKQDLHVQLQELREFAARHDQFKTSGHEQTTFSRRSSTP
jgi:DNA invertase Pin-like site-specific DNA recombinase